MPSHTVIICTFEDMQLLDAVGPAEVFDAANRVADSLGAPGARYSVRLVSVDGGPIRSESGLTLLSEPRRAVRGRIDTLVLPGGSGTRSKGVIADHEAWLRRNAPRVGRLATVCTGAFLAAAAGLLDGRRVTTHWALAELLAERFPALTVDPEPLYIEDGDVWTSAGVTAGIDLALALVERDLGAEVSQNVARWLVMFLHRPGGQSQFGAPVWTPRAERSPIRAVQARVEAAPGDDHSVASLADAAAMSVRNFIRVFKHEVGETPARYVERVRLEAARRELETTVDGLEVVASRCGFGTAETMRRAFQRRLHVPPDTYRRRFTVVA